MSDTPRTDAEAYDTGLLLLEDDAQPDIVVQADFARTIERELAAKSAEVERLRGALQKLANEAAGICGAWEDEVRDAVGNTNYECLVLCIGESGALLKEPQR